MLSPKLLTATYAIVRVMAAQERPPAVTAAKREADVPTTVAAVDDTSIKCDTELARLGVGLRYALALRLWIVAIELCRLTRRNWVTRSQIESALKRYHIKYSQRNLTRWLNQGVGIFWNIDTRTGRYYPIGYANLAVRLVEMAYRHGLHMLYLTNTPGQGKSMFINVASDNIRQFESSVYAAWVASRENLTISRVLLALLWNRTEPVLRSWEGGDNQVKSEPNYTFTDEQFFDAIPRNADGTWRRDVHRTVHNGRDVIAWQIPNTYIAPRTRQHNRKGQHRRVSITLRKLMGMLQPLTVCEESGQAPDEMLNRNPRRYFQQHKGAKDSATRHGNRERYVFKGRWNRYGLFEYTPDGRERLEFWRCRRLFRREQIVCFAKRGKVLVTGEYSHPF